MKGDVDGTTAMATTQGLYRREPIAVHDGIPYFSHSDAYVQNYGRIADDHLAAASRDGQNPFIREDLWLEMENSTAALIRKYTKAGDAILDAGVGLGRLLSRFPHLRRYGMDISVAYLEVARTRGIEVCFARIEEMPYQPNFFDVVVCTDVLEHVFDLNLCLGKTLGVLRTGGTLVLRVPYREDLRSYLASDYPYRYAHIRNFDEWGMRLLLEKVFRCSVLETDVAAYDHRGGRLKHEILSWGLDHVQKVGLEWAERLHPRLYRAMVKKLCHPIVISAAVRKPADTCIVA